MNLGIFLVKLGNVRAKALLIEPTEHLIELLTQDKPHQRKREFLKLHWFSKDTAEDLCSFDVRQLAAGDLQFNSDKLLGALECLGCKSTDIIGRDCLIWLVTADWVGQLAFQDSDFNLVDVVILHESGRAEYGCRQTELA